MRRPSLRTTVRRSALAVLLLPACGDAGSDDAAATPPRRVTFHGEQAPFAAFGHDTGLQPADSPVQVRFVLAAGGALTLDAQALSTGDEAVSGRKGSGRLALDARVTVQATLKVALPAYDYEGPIEGAPDLNVVVQGEQAFDPFLVGGGAGVDLSVAVPETELAAIPLEAATGIPGTLHVKASGTIRSHFSGTCAAASAAGVAYTGVTTTGGPLVLSGTVDIDVPLVGLQTYGPFVMPEIQVGPFEAPLDLGVQPRGEPSADGEAGEAAAPGTCGGGEVDGGAGGEVPTGGSVGPGGGAGSGGEASGGAGGAGVGGMPTGGGAGGSGAGGMAAGGGGGSGGEGPPADASLVGEVCDACPGNPCFDTGGPGLCTFDCTGDMGACAGDDACIPTADGNAYCATPCVPSLGANACAGDGTACDLAGVCLPACRADADCGEGDDCNLDLGLCMNTGTPFARVGDACGQDADCPRNGLCVTDYPGGRCTTRGCDLGGGFTCPQDSTCLAVAEGLNPMVYISLCVPTCIVDDPAHACRDGETCMDVGDGTAVCIPPQ